MKRSNSISRRSSSAWLAWRFEVSCGGAVLLCILLCVPASAQVAVRAKTMHTMAGPALNDAVVLIEDGKIKAVGPSNRVRIPNGVRQLEAATVTPGLIDVRSTLGLSGAYNSNIGPVRDQDQLETSDPIQPELRAIDAYNAREELIAYARSLGVTTIHTGHGPGALISGQTLIAKTTGDRLEQALIEPAKMIAMTFGSLDSDFKKPGTRAKGIAMLRGAFLDAHEYVAKRDANSSSVSGDSEQDGGSAAEDAAPSAPSAPRNLRNEVLAQVLGGEITVLARANSAPEISSALRLQREFGFEMVIDGGAESYLLLDELNAAGVAVFLHPPRARIANKSLETAMRLRDAGVPFAVQTGHEGYVPKTRVLLFEAAHYAANGLEFEQALASITLDSARLLGIEQRVGSIEVGKDGDLVLYTGDPFEYTTQVCAVVIDGEVVSEECR